MEGIGKGLGQAFITVIIVAFLVGSGLVGLLFWLIADSNEFESYNSTLKPVEWQIETNGKDIDTLYIYKTD